MPVNRALAAITDVLIPGMTALVDSWEPTDHVQGLEGNISLTAGTKMIGADTVHGYVIRGMDARVIGITFGTNQRIAMDNAMLLGESGKVGRLLPYIPIMVEAVRVGVSESEAAILVASLRTMLGDKIDGMLIKAPRP